METETCRIQKFLVLVPHRDIRVELQKNRDSELKAGLTGVYTFPCVTPLASLSRTLNDGELKQIAHSLRENIGKNKIFATDNAFTAFPCDEKDLTLFGPRLDINIPQDLIKSVNNKIKYIFPSFVIGCFLIPNFNHNEENKKLKTFYETPQKESGFRASAVANMYWRSLQINGEIYYKWKIGKLCWLPHPQRLK